MNVRKGAVILMAAALIMSCAAGLSACNGVKKLAYDEAMWSTGLTGYDTLDAFRADAANYVTREEAVTQTVVMSGCKMLYALSDEDVATQLGYISAEPEKLKDAGSVAIAVKRKFIYREGKIDLNGSLSGAETAYCMLSVAGFTDELELENAVSLFKKHFKATSEAKSALGEEKLTVGGLYALIYSMLLSTDENGTQIGSRIALDLSVDELTAFHAGIADSAFAARLAAAAEALKACDCSGIVGCILTEQQLDEVKSLRGCYTSTSDNALKSAVSAADKAISAAEKTVKSFRDKAGSTVSDSITAALSVSDRSKASSSITATAPTATENGGKITLENAYSRFVFTTSPFALTSYFNKEINSEMIAEPARIFSFKYNNINYNPENCRLVSAELSEADGAKLLTVSFTAADGALKPVVTVKMDSGAETKFDFTIENLSGEAAEFTPVFPDMGSLIIGDDASDDWYLYPRKGGIISNRRITLQNGLKTTYGGGVTFPLIDLYEQGKGGSYLMLQDDFLQVKDLQFIKHPQNGTTIKVAYYSRDLEADGKWSCATAAVGSHTGDWYNAVCAYKDYVSEWYDFRAESSALDGTVQFKQVFVKQGVDKKELASPDATPSELVNGIFEKGSAFGEYQALHWFDWWDNLGDYKYYPGYGGVTEVRNVADKVHLLGAKFSLYTEGILANTYSDICLNYGNDIYRLTKDGKLQVNNGSYDCTCHLSVYGTEYINRLAEIASQVPVNILYLDQFGNQASSECYNPKHEHTDHYCVLAGQIEILKSLREKLNAIRPGIATGGEYPMTDYASQYTSYCFNYNNSMWYTGLDGIAVKPTADLYTFIFPEVKLYNITIRANPNAGYDEDNNAASAYIEDIDSLKRVFFNGEGRWHDEGYTGWSQECIDFTKKSMRAVEAFEDVFMSEDKTPLLPTGKDDVYVNRFASEDGSKVIWTVLNTSAAAIENVTFTLENAADYDFFELLSDSGLTCSVNGNQVTVEVSIAPDDVAGIAAIEL